MEPCVNVANAASICCAVVAPLLEGCCDGLLDEACPGRPRTIDDDQVAAVIERTLRTTPADIREAHRVMEANEADGKLVVVHG